jgi:valyl-tRNA synthetase
MQVLRLCARPRTCLVVASSVTRRGVSGPPPHSPTAVMPDFEQQRANKHFDHGKCEVDIYNWWEAQGFFEPADTEGAEAYTVIMPPPNVTGRLHMGHAVYASIQDLLCRYHRMTGKSTLWLPGSDHAGIATQYVVMQKLRSEGIDVDTISREEFLKHAWQYRNEKGDEIFHQLRRLGASADWTRAKFTLDSDMQGAVAEAFCRLHDKGLIYKGSYMVNWSTALQTAVSDLEVDSVEEEGKLYYFKYHVVDDQGEPTDDFIPVSTTRPETIPGDRAVCVHPEDTRYSAFVGKSLRVPMSGVVIPVLADSYVDMEFGTGALKVTPAHDPNDYEIGKRHNLEAVNIMNLDGTMNSEAGLKYEGLDRFVCREQIWNDMQHAGLALRVEKHKQRVPRSQRSGEVIEPMLSEQWFMKMEHMAHRAMEAVEKQNVKIVPNKFEKVWFNWLQNNRDWCISRQLWWGHRLPIFYVVGNKSRWVAAKNQDEALQKARVQFGEDVLAVEQDDDVLDTWFSSALWPFITLGWPGTSAHDADGNLCNELTADFKKYYPTAVLETGYDIIFFWVARMAMLGLELTDKSPFHTVYLHGLVRDKNHEKMSKTKGNVVDPLDTINEYGCDALRFALVSGLSPGQDVAFDVEKVKNSRNFANKVWNLGKYIDSMRILNSNSDVSKLDRNEVDVLLSSNNLALPERYIVSRCNQTVSSVTRSLESYSFAEGASTIHDFIWHEFADWYVEVSKTRAGHCSDLQQSQCILQHVWDRCLHMLHPFMPFLTETLWLRSHNECESIMVSQWPISSDEAVDEGAIEGFEVLQALVRAIRAVRSEYKVESKSTIRAVVNFSKKGLSQKSFCYSDLSREKDAVALLARVSYSEL